MFIYRKNSKVNLRKEFFVMIFEDYVVPDFQIRKMKNWHLEQFQSAKELMVWNYYTNIVINIKLGTRNNPGYI